LGRIIEYDGVLRGIDSGDDYVVKSGLAGDWL
jgi:hypothetical protein